MVNACSFESTTLDATPRGSSMQYAILSIGRARMPDGKPGQWTEVPLRHTMVTAYRQAGRLCNALLQTISTCIDWETVVGAIRSSGVRQTMISTCPMLPVCACHMGWDRGNRRGVPAQRHHLRDVEAASRLRTGPSRGCGPTVIT